MTPYFAHAALWHFNRGQPIPELISLVITIALATYIASRTMTLRVLQPPIEEQK